MENVKTMWKLESSSDSSRSSGSEDESFPPPKRFKASYSSSADAAETRLPGTQTSDYYSQDSSHQASTSDDGSSNLPEGSEDESSSDEKSPPRSFNKVAKKILSHREDDPVFDPKAQKMMQNMGYKTGFGLGKNKQGRVAPVELPNQQGRRGFGHHVLGLDGAKLKWDFSLEPATVEETPLWLEDESDSPVEYGSTKTWMKISPKKMTIDDECEFCDAEVVKNVLSTKAVLDDLNDEDLRKARTRANPYEKIRNGIFLNRAAMKMANMDRVFDFMFSQKTSDSTPESVLARGLLYFADICAGPGGFSEYVLWRKNWQAKGFGMTLRNQNDFKLQDFYAGKCQTFEPYYGVDPIEGDGDIYCPKNREAFLSYVLEHTEGKGVHFVMADGGFSVEGQESLQEILSKELYLCQSLLALRLIRNGGHFVCKLFDIFTPFSVGLIYLLYKAFNRISIHKPHTSRPANSERYIICQCKRPESRHITEYLEDIHHKMRDLKRDGKLDVREIVPMSILKEDDAFYKYIVTSSNSIGERQSLHLFKLTTFSRDHTLTDSRQDELRKKCLEYWGVPDLPRVAPKSSHENQRFKELTQRVKFPGMPVMTHQDTELLPKALKSTFTSVYDWHCYVLASSRENSKNCTFFFSMGGGKVYYLDGSRWVRFDRLLNLGPDTLIYAELVQEMQGEGASQMKKWSLHVIDGVILGGDNISHYHITIRHHLCSQYCHAVNRPANHAYVPIRMKEMFDLENIQDIFSRLDIKHVKGSGRNVRLAFTLEDRDEHRHFLPGGILFLKGTKLPYSRHLSRSHNLKYYCSPMKPKESKFDKDRPAEAVLYFQDAFTNRLVWWWEPGVCVHASHCDEDPRKLQKNHIVHYVATHL